MANDLSIVLQGTLGTASSALLNNGADYTVPVGRKLIVMEMSLVNKTATDQTATLTLTGGVVLFPTKTVPKNDGYLQIRQTQILENKQILGLSSLATSIDYYLSCLEVDA